MSFPGLEGAKNKSIIIDGSLHYNLKMYCRGKGLKIGAIVEDLIFSFLENPKEMQNIIDKVKENYS